MMDALIAAIMETPHAGDCDYMKEMAAKCSCGVHDLMRDAVLIKADLAVRLGECRIEALKAIGKLLETFKAK
jgi:hypothetical protein